MNGQTVNWTTMIYTRTNKEPHTLDSPTAPLIIEGSEHLAFEYDNGERFLIRTEDVLVVRVAKVGAE